MYRVVLTVLVAGALLHQTSAQNGPSANTVARATAVTPTDLLRLTIHVLFIRFLLGRSSTTGRAFTAMRATHEPALGRASDMPSVAVAVAS